MQQRRRVASPPPQGSAEAAAAKQQEETGAPGAKAKADSPGQAQTSKAAAPAAAALRPSLYNFGAWSVGDLVAGVTVAATSLPQYIAYAELAGLSGSRGLATSGPPIVAFAFLTTSPSLCIGVTSITALMAHSTLRGGEYLEAHGEERWMDLLGTFSVLVGVVSIVMALLRVTRLAKYVPGAVKAGWKLGFAITVVGAQMAGALFGSASSVKKLCVLPLHQGKPLAGGAAAMYRLGWMLCQPQLWDWAAVAMTAMTLFVVFRCKAALTKLLRLPGIEVIVATILGVVGALLFGYTGDIVGVTPAAQESTNGGASAVASLFTGWLRQWPWEMPWIELLERLGGIPAALLAAGSFACVDFLAILSVVPDGPANELAGQGVGCIVSGLAGSAPIGGSLSRSMVAAMTGAASPLMGLASGLATLLLALPAVGALLAPCPKSVLAAVVLAAVLPGVLNPKDVVKLKGADAVVAWTTALASCLTDPTVGFGAGLAAFALLQGLPSLVRRGSGDSNNNTKKEKEKEK